MSMARRLTKYLFCYFTGNEPENESVHFAVSEDGYHFTALNNNEKIITQTLGKKYCRDPFIFRDEDNVFHIIATDMRCYDGWSSNHSMVLWDSRDLVHWENERIIDFSQFEETKSADRVWAPQVLYDPFQKVNIGFTKRTAKKKPFAMRRRTDRTALILNRTTTRYPSPIAPLKGTASIVSLGRIRT